MARHARRASTSPTLSFHDIYCEPKPLQPGGVPLWVAGTLHARNLDRLVRYGDAWIPIMGETVEGIAAGVRQVRDAWAAAGRDPSALQVQAPLRMVDGRRRPARPRAQHGVGPRAGGGGRDRRAAFALRAFAREPADAPAAMAELVRYFHGR